MLISVFVYLCHVNRQQNNMKSKEYYISQIIDHANEIRKDFGVKSLRLFGSVSRNEQKEGSDIDICVDMEPKMLSPYIRSSEGQVYPNFPPSYPLIRILFEIER